MITTIRTRLVYLVILAVWLLLMLAATQGQTGTGEIEFEQVLAEAQFSEPTYIAAAPDGSRRMLVLERGGVVKAASLDGGEAAVILDLSARVSTQGPEMGLLGLAFAPDFAESGELYLNYTADSPRRTVVARYTMAGDVIAPESEFVVLEQEQPAVNHNGGMMMFGPDDGYLYISFGDGGGGGDQFGNGQNLGTILSSIIRIDVNNSTVTEPYAIPQDNPFVGTAGARGEIWAYGLRNPWRFSIEPGTGVMYSGDVGENNVEEINIIERGGNYGWSIMEGDRCFQEAGCSSEGLILPLYQYTHTEGSCSVTGGYIYRGSLAPSLDGAYIFGDYCSGIVWALREGEDPVEIFDSEYTVASFGLDEAGEMYAVSLEGFVHRIRERGANTQTPTPTAGPTTNPTGTPVDQTPTPTSAETPSPSATPTSDGAATPTPTAAPNGDGGGGLTTTTIVLIGVGVAVAAVAAGAVAYTRFR